MKKLVSVIFAFIIIHMNAHGVVACVPFTSSTTCTTGTTYNYAWRATCGGYTIIGLHMCSNMVASIGATRDAGLSKSTTVTGVGSRNCWCASYSPHTSQWVYAHSFSSGLECEKGCRATCGTSMLNTAAVRSKILTTYRYNL